MFAVNCIMNVYSTSIANCFLAIRLSTPAHEYKPSSFRIVNDGSIGKLHYENLGPTAISNSDSGSDSLSGLEARLKPLRQMVQDGSCL